MRRTILCGILLSMLLVGCSFNTGNTQNIPLQSAAAGAQIEAAIVVPEKEDLTGNMSVEIQAKIDPGQDEAVIKARTQAAAIAQAEIAARMQVGLVKTNASAEKEGAVQEAEQEKAAAAVQAENEKRMQGVAKERAAAVISAAKEVQAAVKAEIGEETPITEQEKAVTVVQAENGKEVQTAAKVKKPQTTAKAAKEKPAAPQAQTDAAQQDAATSVQVNVIEQDVAIPAQADAATVAAQTVQNEAAVVEIGRIYIEDCGSDTGYWQITYSDGHVEYIDD